MRAYDKITEYVLDLMSQGVNPWAKPWTAEGPRFGQHRGIHGHVYRGINAMMTGMVASMRGYQSDVWLTFNQCRKMGGNVKGQKATPVLLWKRIERKNDAGEVESAGAMARVFHVFNADQCAGLVLPEKLQPKPVEPVKPFEAIAAAEAIAAGYLSGEHAPSLEFGGDSACYAPGADTVRMPAREAFRSPEHYYCTLFHELGHSTGHTKRLARPALAGKIHFGDHKYSQEELVAELTACFLQGEAGILDATAEHSAAYLQHWVTFLKSDPQAFPKAAAAAQKAADLILGRAA